MKNSRFALIGFVLSLAAIAYLGFETLCIPSICE